MDKAIADLGTNLAALARNEEDLGCLSVFAQFVARGDSMPNFLGVIVCPDGARIVTIGNPNPGLTLEIGDDLDFDVTQLWYEDDHPGAKKRSRHLRVVTPT